MQNLYDVIYEPVVTEKSVRAMEEDNVYTFIVNEKANKLEIANAVQKLWDVTVTDVRTMRYSGREGWLDDTCGVSLGWLP